MPSPLQFMQRYRQLQVNVIEDDDVAQMCREVPRTISVRKYFMMNWREGTDQRTDFNFMTRGGRRHRWYQSHKEQIKTAAMGKGSPSDYERALEWAVISGKIASPTQVNIQTFCDNRLGIDCSGFATNYLIACGKKPNTPSTARNTNAASYFSAANAVNDPNDVRQGDLLVWMEGNSVKRGPGHIAVVQSYVAQSTPGGNMRVCEATGAAAANPKLLDSMYEVEEILDPQRGRSTMILVVKRHGHSGSRVAVIRP
ncbi:hypothetical protein NHH03_06285 [Stieleria sp. TO1_6]|uniref:CHAP domain-containing protein n=1 Tax=Stieleria tagensis TaxID=2956795 RepID=UPI00209B7186|nr:CHAP domain-containing protein [Stieleria tagensis]MCO8121338.1 hypothetical protein [Stieleria tagensis]